MLNNVPVDYGGSAVWVGDELASVSLKELACMKRDPFSRKRSKAEWFVVSKIEGRIQLKLWLFQSTAQSCGAIFERK